MPEAHLVLDRLTVRGRGQVVLDGLTLRLERGQTLALLGPVGSGKTVALLALAGFLRPVLGTIRLGGRDITAAPPESRNIAMAFDTDALFPHLPVIDNVAFGLKMHGVGRDERRARAAATLAALRIGPLAERHPARLNPSERRLVALARAAATNPALLLIDEPSAPEHAAEREAARAVLREALGPDHTTAILATHDRAAAFALADRVAVLRDGRLEQFGTPPDIYEQPATRFVASFTGGCNLLPATLLHESGGEAVIGINGSTAAARCLSGMRPGPVTLCIRPHKLRLDQHATVRGTVEAVDYQGAISRITLRAGAERCVAETTQPPPGLARGDAVVLGWNAADSWLIPPEAPP